MSEPTGLDGDDHGRILAALERVGAASSLDEFAELSCRALLELVPGISTSFNEAAPLAGRIASTVWPDPGAEWYERWSELVGGLLYQHPYMQRLEGTGDGSPASWLDLDPDREFESSELYRSFYAQIGIRSQLLFALPSPPTVVIVLAVNRDGEQFTDRERALCEVLRVHLAYLHRLLAQREVPYPELEGASVVVSDTGEVIASSPEAEQLGTEAGIELAVGASLAGTALWGQLGLENRERPWAIASGVRIVVVGGREHRWEVLVRTAPVGPHLLAIRSPSPVTVARAEALGLTPRQAEVAVLLVDGLTNDQIATRLGLSAGTVRKHLEGIFERLEVSSRSAAAVALVRSE